MTRAWLALALAMCLGARSAAGFGGMYLGTDAAPLVSDGGLIVVVRDGTRTVLAIQPRYQGPRTAFALVIPVPASVQERDVAVLAPEVLAAIERTSAPRLVEYREQDPCAPPTTPLEPRAPAAPVEDARITSREYQIAIVAAKDSAALDSWLRREKYVVPASAEPLLREYIARGMKLVVAKVDPAKLAFTEGGAVLSPLRIEYDSAQVVLPMRLGLANSAGAQDVIVHIFAPDARYEAANQGNVTIPTNLTVEADARDRFSAFYATLLDAMLARHPGAVITEHAGAVVGALGDPRRYVLTRLHARYDKALREDLALRPAPAIAGGRERIVATGRLEDGAHVADRNAFAARYVIRRPWRGPLACESPVRGRWIEDPAGPRLAADLAMAPRGALDLATMLEGPELATADAHAHPIAQLPPSTVLATGAGPRGGCRATGEHASTGFVILALLLLVRRRSR